MSEKIKNYYFRGLEYEHGIDQPASLEKAIEMYEKAAKSGDPYGYLSLGDLYLKGIGFAQSYEKAYECYKKAEQIDEKCAFYSFGEMYSDVLFVEHSYEKAFNFFKKDYEINDSSIALNRIVTLIKEGYIHLDEDEKKKYLTDYEKLEKDTREWLKG